ncbi:MAG: hypothetical protein LQ338_007736 [Usnochroma carphineum]|nr:MAG: hypothetical protein LQ338_007736 [Usnochroma carphineum]
MKTDADLSKPPIWPQAPENATSTSNSTGPFPAGSYTLITFLDTVQTDCSSQAQDWSCYPYHTHNQSASQATANFTWVITSSGDGFSVSSTSNPWSINFDGTPLTLVDAGTDNERYQFNTSLNKITVPTIGVNCFFNDTNLEGNLYTQKAPTYLSSSPANPPAANPSSPATSDDFQPWPYAVEVRQTIGGGQTVPECFRIQDDRKGDRITDGITPQGASAVCSCDYRNFGS